MQAVSWSRFPARVFEVVLLPAVVGAGCAGDDGPNGSSGGHAGTPAGIGGVLHDGGRAGTAGSAGRPDGGTAAGGVEIGGNGEQVGLAAEGGRGGMPASTGGAAITAGGKEATARGGEGTSSGGIDSLGGAASGGVSVGGAPNGGIAGGSIGGAASGGLGGIGGMTGGAGGSTQRCAQVTTEATPASPASLGEVVQVDSVARCDGSLAEIEVRHAAPGRTFEIIQPYSATPRFTWNTRAEAAGLHSFEVRARIQGSAAQSEASAQFDYILLSRCSQLLLNFDPPGQVAVVGNTVTLSATATCGGTPEYEFLMGLVSDGIVEVVQPWTTNATFVWNTQGVPLGQYWARVDVRNQGASAESDLVAGGTLTLSGPSPCSDAALVAAPGSPATIGTPVELRATSPCQVAKYQFRVQPPGGEWTVLRDWDWDPTADWETVGSLSGQYQLEVRVRQNGSTEDYEARAGIPYGLGTASELCGTGRRDPGEICDGDDLGGATCASVTGYEKPGGTLKCNSTCTFDISECGPYPPLPSWMRDSYSVVYADGYCTQMFPILETCTAEPRICYQLGNRTASILIVQSPTGMQAAISGVHASGTYPLVPEGENRFTAGMPPSTTRSWVSFSVFYDGETGHASITFGDPEERISLCTFQLASYNFFTDLQTP